MYSVLGPRRPTACAQGTAKGGARYCACARAGGTITYSHYGSLGNPFCYFDGTNSVGTLSDGAGRVTQTGIISASSCANWNPTTGFSKLYLTNTYDQTGAGDSAGKLTRRAGYNPRSFPGATVTQDFSYFGLGGRLFSKTTSIPNAPGSPVMESWNYNLLGLVATHSHPRLAGSSFQVTPGYDAGLPTSITANGYPAVTSVAYQPSGAVGSYVTGNGVTTTILQDGVLPRPLSISTTGATPSNFSTGSYSYDGAGNIRAMGSDTFSYDARSRLASATLVGLGTQNFQQDRYGNLTQKGGQTYSVNPANNRLTTASYDARGNLTVNGSETFAYDDLNRQTRYVSGVTAVQISRRSPGRSHLTH